jgi:hypothetical protein
VLKRQIEKHIFSPYDASQKLLFVEFISFFTTKILLLGSAAIELGMAEILGAGAAPLNLLTSIVSRLDVMYIYVFLDLSYPSFEVGHTFAAALQGRESCIM